jgi:K+-transporting ATPase A subunit
LAKVDAITGRAAAKGAGILLTGRNGGGLFGANTATGTTIRVDGGEVSVI